MKNWINSKKIQPPKDKPLLAYTPEWCDTEYSVVTWNGSKFECEIHGDVIDKYVERWCLIVGNS